MELLHMPKELPGPVPMPQPLAGRDGPRPVLKSNSLARMDELQLFLKQCDDKQATQRYYKVLSTCSRDALADFARQLKHRAAQLAAAEQREYKRAKLLHVMGTPCTLPVATNSADADAFATEVLAGEEMEAADAPQQQQWQDYATPALLWGRPAQQDAVPRAQQEAAAAIDAAIEPASTTTAGGSSPNENSPPLLTGHPVTTIADHQLQHISPDGGLTGQEQVANIGNGRSWQPMLPNK